MRFDWQYNVKLDVQPLKIKREQALKQRLKSVMIVGSSFCVKKVTEIVPKKEPQIALRSITIA